MAKRLHLDFETRSVADLLKVGAHRYFADPSTKILCAAYRFDNGPVGWWCDELDVTIPPEVVVHVHDKGLVVAHNAAFERLAWNTQIAKGLEKFFMRAEQMDCTMSRAQALALPASLGEACNALAVKIGKDREGRALMMRMCKPLKWVDGKPVWLDGEDNYKRLVQYCRQDVEAECAIDEALPPLSARERRVWELDQKINDRGIPIDVDLVRRAQAVAEIEALLANADLADLTQGRVTKASQHKRMADWLAEKGLDVSQGVGKDVIGGIKEEAEALGFQDVLDAIQVKADAAKSSVAKFRAMLGAEINGRVYGGFAYHAATTGRWAGRIVQPHNLPRVDEDDEATVAEVVQILEENAPEDAHLIINMQYGKVLKWLSLALRSMIKAPKGKKFVGADFSNIEGRYNAWMAGEEWKLEAFRAFDRGEGPDLYKVTSGRITGKAPADVTKKERQESGKVPELSLGFMGGYRALQKMAKKYNVKMTNQRAEEIKVAWRGEHPRTVESWKERQAAAVAAVESPGMVVEACGGKVAYISQGGFLLCRLPSQRILAYARPSVRWSTKTIVLADGDEIEITGANVHYWAVDSDTKKWSEQSLYGGLQCENDVQGGARDCLVDAMFIMEDNDFPLCLHVHDELMAEVDEDDDCLDEFSKLMAQPVEWAPGLPIAVSPWEGPRYG